MWNLLGQAAIGLAPSVIDALLSSGAPAEMSGGRMVPAASKEKIAKTIEGMQRRGKNEKQIAEALGKAYGGRKSVQALSRELSPSMLRRLRKGAGAAFGIGLPALFAAPILMDLLGGRGEEAGPMPGGAAGGEGDLLALMSALEGQAGRNAIDTRAQERYTSGLTQMLDREQAARAMPSTLGMGLGGLEEIIRGNEEMLGQIAHSEPMSLAQAYAMQGLYRPMEGARVDFRGIM